MAPYQNPRYVTEEPSSNSGAAAAVLVPMFLIVVLIVCLCCFINRRCMSMGVNFLRWWYDSCFFRLDCAAKLDLKTTILRYWENPPLSREQNLQNTPANPYIRRILLHLANQLPEFFFSILPTGSLREGYGKLQPSTAILATDYDLMLIPDGITVGSRDEKEATNQRTSPTFITTENKMIPTGFIWLSLDYKKLKHWKKLTIPRQVEDAVGHYLSITRIHQLLSKTIKDIVFTEVNGGAKEPTVKTNGPAITVKVERNLTTVDSFANSCCPCCKDSKLTLFECDFTIGIHHPSWPTKAENWCLEERRKYWPPQEVVDRIKDRGCHVVPKASVKGTLLKYNAAQPTLTTYDQAPTLEWRYSFSQPELELSDCIPVPAKQAFMALKAVNKAHLRSRSESEKNLSYELKTILLRTIEQQPPEHWAQRGVEGIFRDLVENLHRALTSGVCLHYWIEDINLLEEFSQLRLTELAKRVDRIQRNPRRYVADNWLEVTRCLRFYCLYCGPRSVKTQLPWIKVNRDPCLMIPCSYGERERGTCCPCPYDDINFEVY